MATIPEALALAVQHHQKGHLQQAEEIYRQILQVAPNHAHALHLLGVTVHQMGNNDLAVQYSPGPSRSRSGRPMLLSTAIWASLSRPWES